MIDEFKRNRGNGMAVRLHAPDERINGAADLRIEARMVQGLAEVGDLVFFASLSRRCISIYWPMRNRAIIFIGTSNHLQQMRHIGYIISKYTYLIKGGAIGDKSVSRYP